MYSDGEHSTGSFGTIPRETYVKLCSKSAAVLTPRVHMKPIVGTAVPDQLNYHRLACRRMCPTTVLSEASRTPSPISVFVVLFPFPSSPSQLSEPQSPPIQTLNSRLVRPLWPRMSSKSLYAAFPAHKCVYVAPLAWLNTYLTCCPRSRTVPAWTFVHLLSDSQNVQSPPWPD